MVNEDYEPTQNEEAVLDTLTDGRADDNPWGRANPKFLKQETGLNDQQINYALNQLSAAGWVRKLTTGLWEYVDDPREGTDA